MKITIYELLGLIKDGKAPKKIKYKEMIFTWDYEIPAYFDNKCKSFAQHYMDRTNMLNDFVEILDEEDEFIDIEEFKEHQIFNTRDIFELQMFINKRNAEYDCKINDLIKNQKKIIERLKDGE